MPYSENHVLLRFGGSAWGDQESWSCGLRMRQAGGDSPEALLDNAIGSIEEIAGLVEAYVERIPSRFSAGIRLNYVGLNPISAATGDYLFPNQPVEVVVDPPGQPTQSLGYPQIAYCVTLRSSLFKRGPAARGRWYVPAAPLSPLVTSTGVMSATGATEAADSAGTFLQDLTQLTGPTDPNLWTPWLYGDGIGGPRDSPIGEVSVGNVYDTQRRRRRSIAETYTVSTTWNGGV